MLVVDRNMSLSGEESSETPSSSPSLSLSGSRIDLARDAFESGDPTTSQLVHAALVTREDHKKGLTDTFKSLVYGSLSGCSVSWAIVAVLVSHDLPPGTCAVISISLLLSLGIFSGIFDWITSTGDVGFVRAEMRREEWEYDNYPDGEKNEMIEIYMEKGLSEKDAVELVEILSKNKSNFIDTMMAEELAMLPPTDQSLVPHSMATAAGYLCGGLLPVVPFFFGKVIGSGGGQPSLWLFLPSCILSAVMLFFFGALASKWSDNSWWKLALFMLGSGSAITGLAYLIGWWLRSLL